MKLPEFNEVFQNEKRRIAAMELRFVVEENDIRQTMLEIYVSMETKAAHNTFATT